MVSKVAGQQTSDFTTVKHTDLLGRSARNPDAPSYLDNPLAKHYSSQHKDCENPKLELEILKRAATTTDRKIEEARVI